MDRQDRLSRLIGSTRAALAAQVVALVVAIALALPGYIDRLVRPIVCDHCFDFRGFDFFLWTVFFAPPAAVLIAATWLLRPRRIWPAGLALAVDLVVLGVAAYAFFLAIGGQRTTDPDPSPLPVQIVQDLLVLIPAVVSLRLVVRVLNTAHGSSVRLIQTTRNVLVAQVLAMVACVSFASPSLSDRLSSSYGGPFRGVAFALWTALLVPAGLAILAAAWRLDRRRSWQIPLAGAVSILLIGVVGLTPFASLAERLDPVQAGLERAQILLVVLPALASLLMLTLLGRSRSPEGGGRVVP